MFEMAAPIQSPAKCEVHSVISSLKPKGERPAEIQKQIVAVYGNPGISTCLFKFDDDDEVQEEVMTWFKGLAADFYDSGIQKLVLILNKSLDNAGDYVENKVMYRQFIQSVAFVN